MDFNNFNMHLDFNIYIFFIKYKKLIIIRNDIMYYYHKFIVRNWNRHAISINVFTQNIKQMRMITIFIFIISYTLLCLLKILSENII